MKRSILPFITAIVVTTLFLFTGCSGSSGSGEVITETKEVSNFDTLEIGSAFDVDISYGETHTLVISADEGLFDYIEVTQTGTNLKVYLSPHHIFHDFTRGDRELDVKITMPVLKGLDISGACDGKITGFHSTENLLLNVSGATKLELDGIDTGIISGEVSGASRLSGNVTATSVSLEISGASSLEFDGYATLTSVEVSGASRADLEGFRVGDVDAIVSGASEVTVFAEKTLDVNVSGASRLFFIGNPTLGQSNISGASTIKHKE